ncbi:unnamed protein product [Dicrocoelium dendriticum]|nr:unnamed protein product [Dicrocoelium dendriticum]
MFSVDTTPNMYLVRIPILNALFMLLVPLFLCNTIADDLIAHRTATNAISDRLVTRSGQNIANQTGTRRPKSGLLSVSGALPAIVRNPQQDNPSTFVSQKESSHPHPELPTSDDMMDEDHIRQIRTNFRSYENIKSEFATLNLTIRSDLEIMDKLLNELRQGLASEERYLTIFEDLSYLLHQVDNGVHLAENGGLLLLQPFLSHENSLLQRASLLCLSAAIQGNAVVKISALQSGLLDKLCSVLSFSSSPTSPTSDESFKVLSAGLTALSALLRDFPSAQQYFFSEGSHSGMSGFDFLTRLFVYELSVPQSKQVVNLRVRIVTLLSDIALERANARQQSVDKPNAKSLKLWELYSRIPFELLFLQSGWCTRACEFLVAEMEGLIQKDVGAHMNHDQLQRVLFALLHLSPICGKQFAANVSTNKLLLILERKYLDLSTSKESEFDLFFTDLHKLLTDIIELLRKASSSTRKFDEL